MRLPFYQQSSEYKICVGSVSLGIRSWRTYYLIIQSTDLNCLVKLKLFSDSELYYCLYFKNTTIYAMVIFVTRVLCTLSTKLKTMTVVWYTVQRNHALQCSHSPVVGQNTDVSVAARVPVLLCHHLQSLSFMHQIAYGQWSTCVRWPLTRVTSHYMRALRPVYAAVSDTKSVVPTALSLSQWLYDAYWLGPQQLVKGGWNLRCWRESPWGLGRWVTEEELPRSPDSTWTCRLGPPGGWGPPR